MTRLSRRTFAAALLGLAAARTALAQAGDAAGAALIDFLDRLPYAASPGVPADAPVVTVLYAPWCGYCGRLAAQTVTDRRIAWRWLGLSPRSPADRVFLSRSFATRDARLVAGHFAGRDPRGGREADVPLDVLLSGHEWAMATAARVAGAQLGYPTLIWQTRAGSVRVQSGAGPLAALAAEAAPRPSLAPFDLRYGPFRAESRAVTARGATAAVRALPDAGAPAVERLGAGMQATASGTLTGADGAPWTAFRLGRDRFGWAAESELLPV